MKKIVSRETGGMLNKGDQSAFILCTSLYALELQGESEPTRKRVLTYIRVRKLIAYEALGSDIWADEKKTWLQFFSWCRETIATDGLIAYRGSIDRGFWRLSGSGREFVEKRLAKWCALEKSAQQMLADLRDFQHECIYSLPFLELVLQLGRNQTANQPPQPMPLTRRG